MAPSCEDGAVARVGEAVGEVAEAAEPLVGRDEHRAGVARPRRAHARRRSVMRPWSNCFTETSTKWSGTRSPARHGEAGLVGDHHRVRRRAPRVAPQPPRRRRGSRPGHERRHVLDDPAPAARGPTGPRARATTAAAARRAAQAARRAGSRAAATSRTRRGGTPPATTSHAPERGARPRRATGRVRRGATTRAGHQRDHRRRRPRSTTTNGSRSTSVVIMRHAASPTE